MPILFKPEHIPPILSGQKTQTRRLWTRWRVKEGGLYWAQTKLFEPLSRFARIKCLRRWKEPLGAISREDALAEGAESIEHYFQIFRQINGDVPLDTTVCAVEFRVAEIASLWDIMFFHRLAGTGKDVLEAIWHAWHEAYSLSVPPYPAWLECSKLEARKIR